MIGTLAQLVEQRTFNPFVVGSTPARPTKILVVNQAPRAEMPGCFFLSMVIILVVGGFFAPEETVRHTNENANVRPGVC